MRTKGPDREEPIFTADIKLVGVLPEKLCMCCNTRRDASNTDDESESEPMGHPSYVIVLTTALQNSPRYVYIKRSVSAGSSNSEYLLRCRRILSSFDVLTSDKNYTAPWSSWAILDNESYPAPWSGVSSNTQNAYSSQDLVIAPL